MFLFHPLQSLLHLLVSAICLIATAYVVPGFRVKDFGHALIAAFVIGLANAFIYPVLWILTLPLTILTLGLFTFVLDAIILKLVSAILRGFEVASWGSALVGALILAIVGAILHGLFI